MSNENVWKCTSCGDLNRIGCGKCRCGMTESKNEEVAKQRLNEARQVRKYEVKSTIKIVVAIVLFLVTMGIIISQGYKAVDYMDKLKGNPREALSDVKLGCQFLAYVFTPIMLIAWGIFSQKDSRGFIIEIVGYIITMGICGLLFWFLPEIFGKIIVIIGAIGVLALVIFIFSRVDPKAAQEVAESYVVENEIKQDLKNHGEEYVKAHYYKDKNGNYKHWYQ